MSDHVDAYPLQWPQGWQRTTADRRERARFSRKDRQTRRWGDGTTSSWSTQKELSIADGTHRVLATLERMGLCREDIVISSDLQLRLDGLPRSGQRTPDDPGVAVYWRHGGDTRCMAIDRYDRIADNLAAIAATLEAMRAIERHGGAEILNRAFTGFTELPSPTQWWHIMGFESTEGLTRADIDARYRKLSMQRHPDREGGSDQAMSELNWARDTAYEQIGGD